MAISPSLRPLTPFSTRLRPPRARGALPNSIAPRHPPVAPSVSRPASFLPLLLPRAFPASRDHAVATFGLRLIHRGVRARDQLLRGIAVGRILRGAHAHPDPAAVELRARHPGPDARPPA